MISDKPAILFSNDWLHLWMNGRRDGKKARCPLSKQSWGVRFIRSDPPHPLHFCFLSLLSVRFLIKTLSWHSLRIYGLEKSFIFLLRPHYEKQEIKSWVACGVVLVLFSCKQSFLLVSYSLFRSLFAISLSHTHSQTRLASHAFTFCSLLSLFISIFSFLSLFSFLSF